MTMFVGVRLWRPSAVSLVLVLVVAVLAPLVLAPTPAQADVCDLPGVSQVCDGAGAAAGAVDDAADAVGDVARGVIKGVKTAATWAGQNAGKIAAAALAVGLPLATWVACSKVTKVVAAAGAGTAAGTGSGGVGAAPAAIAGAAGAEAVCQLLKKGGKVVLKVGKKAAKSGGKLANIAKLAAGAVGLAAIVYGVDHAAAWVLQNLLDLDAASAPNLDAGWLTQLRQGLNGMAGLLLLLATIVGMTLAGALGRASDVGRIFTSMVSVALMIGVVGSLLLAGLRVSDEVTSQTLNSTWGQKALGNWKDLGDSYADATPKKGNEGGAPAGENRTQPAEVTAGGGTAAAPSTGTPQDDEKGPWPIRLLIAFCTALFGALVWLEMQIRDGLLYLLLAFGGLLLAAYPLPATRGIAQKFGMTLLGVVIAKPVIVITLLIGGAMMQSAAAGGTDGGAVVPMLQGAGLMALAALMGTAILAWFNLHGAAAMTGLGNRMATGAGRGFGGFRSGGSSGSGGPSGSGPGGGEGGGPDRLDPTRDLVRGVGDRVNAGGAGMAGAGAVGAAAGFAGGAVSSRLQAAQAREAGGPAGSVGGLGPDAGGGQVGAAGPAPADAPTQQMPIEQGVGQAAGGDGPALDAPDRTPNATPAGVGDDGRSEAGAGGSAAGYAAAVAAGGAARGTSSTGGPQASADLAGGAGAARTKSAADAPTGADHVASSVAPGAPAVAGPSGPAPGEPASSPSLDRPVDGEAPVHGTPQPAGTTPNAAAYAAFGAPAPEDAAAAFDDHAAQVRAALDARPEVRA